MPDWFRLLLVLRFIYYAKRDGLFTSDEPCISPEVRRAAQVYIDRAQAELDANEP
jgi:hypothetical protein